MSHHYERTLITTDGSYESGLAFEKGVNIALRNNAGLLLTHAIDTRVLQSVATFDIHIYEKPEQEAKDVLNDYEQQAHEKELTKVKQAIEFGNPKTLLVRDISDKEKVDLIMVGATGFNTFERLLIDFSSEYIMRCAKVDLPVVRDSEKTF